MISRLLRLTRVSFILEPALVVGPKIGVRMFGCYGPSELKLALRFRFRISPLRRGFLVSGPCCVLRWVRARRIGTWLVCLLVLVWC